MHRYRLWALALLPVTDVDELGRVADLLTNDIEQTIMMARG